MRRKRFIPRDDGIDLAMLREDYEQFCTHCLKELLEEWRISKKVFGLNILNTDKPRLD